MNELGLSLQSSFCKTILNICKYLFNSSWVAFAIHLISLLFQQIEFKVIGHLQHIVEAIAFDNFVEKDVNGHTRIRMIVGIL
ncbi:MAG: hypothetical protein CMI05_14500 [Oceanospirillaceae bacterium]|nr:hypothetical protein [Oceanospirillaceae bacterium]